MTARATLGLRLLIAWVALATTTRAWSADPDRPESPPPPRSQPALMFGACELTADPVSAEGRAAEAILGCVRASAGGEMTFVSGTPQENTWTKFGHLYGGVFVNHWFSLQARGHARVTVPLGDNATEDKDYETDYAAIELGNAALNSLRFTAGRLRLPFGVDRSEAPEQYQSFEDRGFWDSPKHGAYVTIDNRSTSQVELGYGTNALTDRKRDEDERQELEAAGATPDDAEKLPLSQAASLRFMTDFAALDGSRLVLSGYGEKAGARRMGAGFVSESRKDDLTYFEFVRRLSTPSGREEPFAQLIRIGYVGAFRSGNRWVVQFDDERFRFRRGIVDCDVSIWDQALFRLGISYLKSETGDGERRWYVTTGLEAHL